MPKKPQPKNTAICYFCQQPFEYTDWYVDDHNIPRATCPGCGVSSPVEPAELKRQEKEPEPEDAGV